MTPEHSRALEDYREAVQAAAKSEPGYKTGHYRNLVQVTRRLLEIEKKEGGEVA